MQPGTPPRPDLDADGHPILGPAERSRRRRTRVLAIVTVVAVVAAGVSVARDDGQSCDGGGSAAEAPEIGVRWVVGHRYCFRVSSSASGIVTFHGARDHRVAHAVELVVLVVRSVGAEGTVTATMQVMDESLTVDGQDAKTRAPFELTVSFDRAGVVRSPFGWGVPTGISNGSGLPSPGQFVPLLPPRAMSSGDRWSEAFSFPLRDQGAVTGVFEGTFVGATSVDGRDALELEATYAMAASVNELSVDEQEREQGAESGLPTGAVYVFDADPRTLQQEILLEAESHELLHATLTTDGASEFRIEGLPEGDTRSEPTGFDGTLSLTIDRIF